MKLRRYILVLVFVSSISRASCGDAIAEAVSRIDWRTAPLDLVDPKDAPLLDLNIEFEREGIWKK